MSKIGKKPIAIPEGVTVVQANGTLSVSGKKGTIMLRILPFTIVEAQDREARVAATGTHKQARANWGTMAALIRNAVRGVSEGFTEQLSVEGIGFKVQLEGKTLILHVGFTHPVRYELPEGASANVGKNLITITGIDRALVGQVAAEVRKIKKPEPYKGKGIRYVGEVVRRKAGKKVAGTATAT